MAENTQLPDGITPQMVADAKQQHGEKKVKLIDLPLDDDGTGYKTILACVPSRTVVGQWRRFSEVDPKRADEILVKACVLSHKDEVLADDGLFYGAVTGISKLIPIREGIVKNL